MSSLTKPQRTNLVDTGEGSGYRFAMGADTVAKLVTRIDELESVVRRLQQDVVELRAASRRLSSQQSLARQTPPRLKDADIKVPGEYLTFIPRGNRRTLTKVTVVQRIAPEAPGMSQRYLLWLAAGEGRKLRNPRTAKELFLVPDNWEPEESEDPTTAEDDD